MKFEPMTDSALVQQIVERNGLKLSRFSDISWTIRDKLGNFYDVYFDAQHEPPHELYNKLGKSYYLPYDKNSCDHGPIMPNVWVLSFIGVLPWKGTHHIYFQLKNSGIEIIYADASVGIKGVTRVFTANRYLKSYLPIMEVIGSMLVCGYFPLKMH